MGSSGVGLEEVHGGGGGWWWWSKTRYVITWFAYIQFELNSRVIYMVVRGGGGGGGDPVTYLSK